MDVGSLLHRVVTTVLLCVKSRGCEVMVLFSIACCLTDSVVYLE